jgi:hypothetical protein
MPANPIEVSESNWFFFQRIIISQFSPSDNLFYGGIYFSYVLVMIMLLMASILSICCVKRNKNIAFRPYLISIFASGVAGVASFFFNTYILLDAETALRFSCPVFIATLPYAVLVLGSHFGVFHPDTQGNKSLTKAIQFGMTSVLIILHIILIGLFWDNLRNRVYLAYDYRTNVSFLLARGTPSIYQYNQYNQYALSNEATDLMRSIQSQTEKGQAILTWIEMPYHLDFTRNRIYTFDDYGGLNPRFWLNISFTNNLEDIRKYLNKMGIRYIMLEYNTMMMFSDEEVRQFLKSPVPLYRNASVYYSYFREMMFALAKKSNIIYNSYGIVLIDLE